jgi:histidinol-phosphate aminotransferase
MAGLRLGYIVGAPETVRPLDRIRNQFGVGRLTQIAALESLRDKSHIASVVAAVAEGRADYARFAEAAGCTALPSATNFVAFDLGTAARANALMKSLIENYRVFIRKPAVAPIDRLVRITIGPPEARAILADALVPAIAAL